MRIAYLSAGAGSLRCGACTHDYLLISRLRQLAHEVHVVPVYTPVFSDYGDLRPATGVFLGGISSYLRVHNPGLSRTLRPVRALLDSSALIRLATRSMSYIDPRQLGELTKSVFQGDQGAHRHEIERLTSKLAGEIRPQVVLLSNTMFCGLAGPILAKLNIPIFSNFLGEDGFIMDLPEPFRSECIELIRLHASDLRAVICPSQAALNQAGILLQCTPDRLVHVPAPVDIDVFAARTGVAGDVPTIGHLSVLRPSKGLDLLLRAMPLVAERLGRPARLLIAGQNVNSAHLREMKALSRHLPRSVDCQFLGEITLEQKVALWHACDVACFPSRIPESRGLAAMEAMACGVPIIAPAHGCFPELVASGGGWLFDPGSVEMLARQLASALMSSDRGASAGRSAAEHARQRHDPLQIARQLDAVFQAA